MQGIEVDYYKKLFQTIGNIIELIEKLFLLEQYNLLYTHDGIPQATNYAMFLAEQQTPEKGISVLQKLSKNLG